MSDNPVRRSKRGRGRRFAPPISGPPDMDPGIPHDLDKPCSTPAGMSPGVGEPGIGYPGGMPPGMHPGMNGPDMSGGPGRLAIACRRAAQRGARSQAALAARYRDDESGGEDSEQQPMCGGDGLTAGPDGFGGLMGGAGGFEGPMGDNFPGRHSGLSGREVQWKMTGYGGGGRWADDDK
jgi:hypothetical protein